MTNIEKYKLYEAIIDGLTDNFCMSFFKDGVPEHLYKISTNFTKHEYGLYIQKAEVTGIGYFLRPPKPYFDKKPSNKDVSAIKKMAETLSPESLDKSNIRIHAKDGNCSWANTYDDLLTGVAAFTKEEIEPVLEKKIERYKENYLVKDGQFMCAYCRKATDNSKKIKRTVIAAQYTNFRKEFDYCSDRCAGHDQMAHEG